MFRYVTASFAIALVALSVAAIVMAQDRGPALPDDRASGSQMRVSKLPPVDTADPKADILRLDHYGRGSVSQARLVDANETGQSPAQKLESEPKQFVAPQTLSTEQIEAAKLQSAHDSASLSSSMQRDLGVILAADWSATHKATRSTPRTDLPANPGANEPHPAQAGQGVSSATGRQPYDSRFQQRQSSSLQDKLNSLRDSITGANSEPPARNGRTPHPASLGSARGAYPNRSNSPSASVTNSSNSASVSDHTPLRSNAPEAPSIPSTVRREGTPTLAEPNAASSVVSQSSKTNPLQSSRQRRDLDALDELASESKSTDSSSMLKNRSLGAASVASEPIPPAVPRTAEQEPTEDQPLLAGEPEQAPTHVASVAPIMTRQEPEEEAEVENVLMSLEGPQLTAQAVGPRRIVVSRNAEFQVTVKNSGSVDANDVIVSVQLPVWVDLKETDPSRGTTQLPDEQTTGAPLLWRINRLAANSSEVLKLNLIPRRSQPLDMSVRWTYAHAGSNTLVEVEEPLLQMVISGPSEAVYGQTKLYNLTLSNPGTGDAKDVVVSLLPLEGKQESEASTNIGTLAHGETKTIQVELSAGKAGMLLVQAKATAEGGLKAEATKEVLVRRANLVIEVVAPEAEYAGNAAGYLVRVTNNGNANADDVTVNAVLPEGAEFEGCTADGRYEAKQGRVRWDIGSLSAGQMREFELSAKLHNPGENRLHTTAQDKSDLNAVADVLTAVVARADLKLLVMDPKGPVPVGDDAVYELHIRNRGTEKAEAIEAVIFFSEGIEPITVEGADHEIGRGQVVFKTIPQVGADGEIVLKVTARAERAGNHVFRAEVLCRSIGTKLAAEETTHFYGKELAAEASQPIHRTATKQNQAGTRGPVSTARGPSPLPPASIDQGK